MSISRLSGLRRVSRSVKSLVGDTGLSSSGKSFRYSSIMRLSSWSESEMVESRDTSLFKMLFNFAGLAIPEHPVGDRCTRCNAELESWMRLTPGMKSWRNPMLMFGGTCGRMSSATAPPLSELAFAWAGSGAASAEVERSVAAGSPSDESGPTADRAGAGEELAEKLSPGLCK